MIGSKISRDNDLMKWILCIVCMIDYGCEQ